MIVRFDRFDRVEKPRIELCNPGSYKDGSGAIVGMLGVLSCTEAEENVFNFNATSELNFRINLYATEDSDTDALIRRLYAGIQNRRLLHQDGVGFFEITDVTDGFSDGVYYKDVSAKSIEAELEHKTVPYITGTNPLEEVLYSIADPLRLWSVDRTIDRELLDRYRTIEDVDESKNCLAFLLEEVQTAYDCVITFDIDNRVISAFDRETEAVDTGIFLSREDLIDSVTVSEKSDELYTALRVTGENGLSIHPVNPTGSGVIYNFSHYLEWMPVYLRDSVREWQNEIAENEERRKDADIPADAEEMTFAEASETYYGFFDKQTRLLMEIEKVEMQKALYESCVNTVDQSVSDIIDVQKIVTTVEEAESDNTSHETKPPTRDTDGRS